MKILYTNAHNFNGGGHATYILALAQGLGAQHDIVVATPGTSRLYKKCRDLGVRLIDQQFSTRMPVMFGQIAAIRRLLKRERFDIVHVNGPGDHRHLMLATIGLRRKPAIVWTKHNTKPINSIGNALRARLGTNLCVAVSEYVAALLAHSPYADLPRVVIHHGIDPQKFHPPSGAQRMAARESFFGSDHELLLVFGSVGGTDLEKGWLDLVAAAATLPVADRSRVRVLVAGDPPSASVKYAVARLGMSEQVVFPGLLADIRPVFAASDIGFVLSHAESASYANLEAMSSGLPVCVSDAGGLPEYVRDEVDGWIVKTKDVAAIADVLSKILAGRYDLPHMGANARLHLLNCYTLTPFLRRTQDAYRRSLAG